MLPTHAVTLVQFTALPFVPVTGCGLVLAVVPLPLQFCPHCILILPAFAVARFTVRTHRLPLPVRVYAFAVLRLPHVARLPARRTFYTRYGCGSWLRICLVTFAHTARGCWFAVAVLYTRYLYMRSPLVLRPVVHLVCRAYVHTRCSVLGCGCTHVLRTVYCRSATLPAIRCHTAGLVRLVYGYSSATCSLHAFTARCLFTHRLLPVPFRFYRYATCRTTAAAHYGLHAVHALRFVTCRFPRCARFTAPRITGSAYVYTCRHTLLVTAPRVTVGSGYFTVATRPPRLPLHCRIHCRSCTFCRVYRFLHVPFCLRLPFWLHCVRYGSIADYFTFTLRCVLTQFHGLHLHVLPVYVYGYAALLDSPYAPHAFTLPAVPVWLVYVTRYLCVCCG